MALDVSDDSQMIASGSADKNVRLWSTQFGNCLKSLKAHEESVMQVKFLPGTHYLATAGRDHKLKLWDCDSYELITALPGHACEILAMALSQDAAFIVTAGSDKQIRIWRRTQEQLFLSEERAKELEEQFEQEVEREDLAPAAAVAAPRPTRRSVESVRTTERLMDSVLPCFKFGHLDPYGKSEKEKSDASTPAFTVHPAVW
ncbi:Wdr3 [Symbiodinium sp. KB8]|nr:Wdr3 [Symbiodinium sp. KB8]